MVATDRLSAFDVVMPVGITYKGQILNQIAFDMLKSTEDIIDNWIIDELKAIGLDTAKSVLEMSNEDLIARSELEEETIEEIKKILEAEFE